MSGKKRIYVVTMTLDIGGTETQILSLCRGLSPFYDISLFSLSTTGPFRSKFEEIGVALYGPNHPFPKSRFILLMRAIFLFFYMVFYIIFRGRAQVIQSYLPLPNFLGALIGFFFNIPFISCWRSLTDYRQRNSMAASMDKISLCLSKKIVCNSKAVLQDVSRGVRKIERKGKVIYNGLIEVFPPLTSVQETRLKKDLYIRSKDICLIYVANLIPYKGHRDLIKAVSLMPTATLGKVKLFFVGKDCGIGKDLKKHATSLGVGKNLYFLGLRQDVFDVLRVMDIGVMASHEEGFSNALLEKLVSGLSVVATDVGGNKEALSGMENCFLVPSRDPHLLSESILSAIRSLNIAPKKWKKRNIERINNRFSNKKMVEEYLALYETLKS